MGFKGSRVVLLLLFLVVASVRIEPVHSVTLSLVVSPAIPSIPSDGKPHPAFFISIQDSTGKPYPLPYSVKVTVTCSDDRVLQVPSSAVIGAAAYYVIVNATSSVSEKMTVEVTVSASGFQSSKINAVVEPPAGSPSSLRVTLLPDTLLPKASAEAEVFVTIVDAYGKPARARSDTLVALFSSNLQIGYVFPDTVFIPKGEFSSEAKVVCKGFAGSTTITASTSDLKSDSATLTVAGPKPEKIYIWSTSYQALGEDGCLFVGILDKDSNPVKLLSPVTVSLYSSNSSIIAVQEEVTIEAGDWKAYAKLNCINPGDAVIYGSSKELVSGSVKLTGVIGQGDPYSLKLYSLASSFPTDEFNYTAMFVQLVNASGYPTTISSFLRSRIKIDIFSSNTAVLQTDSEVYIEYPRTFANISAIPKYLGVVKVSANAPDVQSAQTSFTVYAPIPSSVRVISPPIPSEGNVDACLLLSTGGTPVQVQGDTNVLLSSSDTRIGEASASTTVPRKQSFAYFKILGRSPGQFALTASGSGIPSTKAQLSVLEVKPSKFYLSYVKPIVNYEFPLVVELLSSLGSSAVAYEPLTINLVSSNTSNVALLERATIEAEKTEILLFGKALSTEKTVLTVSSAGFQSLTAQITPSPVNLLVKILADDYYPMGESAKLKCSVTLEGTPVKEIPVVWKGTGLTLASTVTDSQGVSENTLLVQQGENVIEAGINVGGLGYITGRKVIMGASAPTDWQSRRMCPLRSVGQEPISTARRFL